MNGFIIGLLDGDFFMHRRNCNLIYEHMYQRNVLVDYSILGLMRWIYPLMSGW